MARRANDAYYTPAPVAARCVAAAVEHCLEMQFGDRPKVLEPSAGQGAFCLEVLAAKPLANLFALDIDPAAAAVQPGQLWWHRVGDFLAWEPPWRPDLVIGNPPYAGAEAHVRKALDIGRTGTTVGFLLRIGFLASSRRRRLFREFPPEAVYVVTPRPSFTGGGSDRYDYAFIVWKVGFQGEPTFRWLP